MLATVADIIDAVGGPSEAAKIAGVGKTAVSNWKTRGFIPPDHFLLLSDALEKAGHKPSLSVFGFKVAVSA